MESCVACGKETETEELDRGNCIRGSCKTCGEYEISKTAIRRVSRNRSEKKYRLVPRLKQARADKRVLKVIVKPGKGLVFSYRGAT